MKKYTFLFLAFALTVFITGCGRKKDAALQEMQEPMSMEELSVITPLESKTDVVQPAAPVSETKLEPLPPSGPYKPTAHEIQTALKNAGIYSGPIDGKIGPLSKKAIEEFQKVNGLEVDGKVGLKTWAVLGKHLNPAPQPVEHVVSKPKKR